MSNMLGGIPISVLDDCCLRFLGELDSEDFKDSVRVFFKIEEAHWFYLDHFCESNPILPKVALRDFCEIVCSHFPQLHRFLEYLDEYWKAWKQYKASIPTAGAILLDESLEYVLVLEGFPGRRWGFPKGKKNNNESMQECAVREVFEETGYDITQKITPDEYLELAYEDMFVQLFIVHGISRDTVFKPQTKGEVKSFEWMPVRDLPGATGPQNANPKYKSAGFYMIRPFINPLKRWIEMNRKVILGTDIKPEATRRSSLQKNKPPPLVQEPPANFHNQSKLLLDTPFAVQKHAALKTSPMNSPPKPTTNPFFVKTEISPQPVRVLRQEDPQRDGEVAVQQKQRKAFPAIVFEDFVPAAWTPGSIKLDAAAILKGM